MKKIFLSFFFLFIGGIAFSQTDNSGKPQLSESNKKDSPIVDSKISTEQPVLSSGDSSTKTNNEKAKSSSNTVPATPIPAESSDPKKND